MEILKTMEFRLALIYLIPGIAWVFLSDYILFARESINKIHTYKDISFVLVVSVLLYFILKISKKRFIRSKAELSVKEQFLSSLVDSQSNYLIRIYDDYTYRFANKIFQDSFNLSIPDLSKQSFLENIHTEDKKSLFEIFHKCVDKKEIVHSVELRHFCNNQLFYSYWEFRFIKDTESYASVFQGVGYDITVRKLQEEKILQQRKQFREIAFMSSHTIRRPLANILGLTQLVDKKNPCNPLNIYITDKINISAKELDKAILDIVTSTAS